MSFIENINITKIVFAEIESNHCQLLFLNFPLLSLPGVFRAIKILRWLLLEVGFCLRMGKILLASSESSAFGSLLDSDSNPVEFDSLVGSPGSGGTYFMATSELFALLLILKHSLS